MENPFDDLLSEKERNNRSEAAKNEEKRRAIRALSSQYSEMVIKVLAQLRSIKYPDCEVKDRLYEEYPHWSIEKKNTRYGRGTGTELVSWNEKVRIEIVFDVNNNPHFSCSIYTYGLYNDQKILKNIKCPLVREELVETIKQLHQG